MIGIPDSDLWYEFPVVCGHVSDIVADNHSQRCCDCSSQVTAPQRQRRRAVSLPRSVMQKQRAVPALFLAVLAAASVGPVILTQHANALPNASIQYQPYESQNPAFGLFKPANWRVRSEATADSMAISVGNPAGTSVVETLFLANSMHADALAALGAQVKKAKAQFPNLQLSEVVACKNRSCATATETYSSGGSAVKSRFYIQSDPRQIVIRSYRSPDATYDSERNMLLEIMSNIRLGQLSNEAVPLKTAPPEEQQAPPVQEPLVNQQAPDGSASLQVPANWNVQANNGNVTAADSATGVGVVFTNFQVMPNGDVRGGEPGVIVSPYQSSASFILPIFNRWGYRDARILNSTPNRGIMNHCPGGFGGRCDATDFTMSWISPQGVPCIGGFTVINGPQNAGGRWSSTVSGAWAPANSYRRYVPMLSQITNTFAPNGRYSGYYARNSMANAAFFQQGSRGMYGYGGGRSAAQQNWQAQPMMTRTNPNSRWDDSQRGNGNWITQMEGGTPYHGSPYGANPHNGYGMPSDYVQFNGGRSHYSSETMRELNSFEMQQILMH